MERPRYNLFNLIHKALRNMLYDTAVKIQRSDFSSAEEALPVIEQVEQVLFYFEEHARNEDTFILPVVESHEPKLVSDFEYEHDEDHRLAQDIKAFITQWRLEKHSSSQIIWGERIFYTFNKFVAFNLYHMNKEERLLNPVLWKQYTDRELQGITQRIIQSIKPDVLMAQSRWMMKSINRAELFTWLFGVKRAAPIHVFNTYLKMAQEELPQLLWLEVKTVLLEDAVMA